MGIQTCPYSGSECLTTTDLSDSKVAKNPYIFCKKGLFKETQYLRQKTSSGTK